MRFGYLPLVILLAFSLFGDFCSLGAAAAEPAWKEVTIPDDWKKAPPGEKGRLWYRAKVSVPSAWQGRQLQLVVESIDDAREFYFGGQLAGRLGEFPPNYRSALGETQRFTIPSEAVKFGADNTIAIRVCNIEGRTGFNVAAPTLFAGDAAIRLAGKWETINGDDLAWAKSDPATIKTGFDNVQDAKTAERDLKKLANDDGPLSPTDSLARLKTLDDLTVDLVLSEPHIGQPLSMKWDSRGRLWVVNYLQYPNPAGLKMVSQDKFLRSVYDQVPPAPPNHFRGADKITFHEAGFSNVSITNSGDFDALDNAIAAMTAAEKDFHPDASTSAYPAGTTHTPSAIAARVRNHLLAESRRRRQFDSPILAKLIPAACLPYSLIGSP